MRYRYIIKGLVQGVGFRPAVYRVATKLGLNGVVFNSSLGVVIEIEGKNRDFFIKELLKSLPPLARVDSIKKEELSLKNYTSFRIIASKKEDVSVYLLPDKAVCNDCLRELKDINNRRYKYPFITCTNCGPRYSLIYSLPYDRENTSMRFFPMCDDCKKEYINPLDRRFNAEIISCFKCGPSLFLYDRELNKIESKNKIEFISKVLKNSVVAIKGIGGFHLVGNAANEEVVKRIREIKKRPLKPFALMFKDIDSIKEYAVLSSKDVELLKSKEAPIVLTKKIKELKGVADLIDYYGVFLPYTPIYNLLFEEINYPLVVTSANISGEPIYTSLEETKKLDIDYILDYDREIVNSSDDSLVKSVENRHITLRLSRGYAPYSVNINKRVKPKILALGAHQKSTFSMVFENNFILSPYLSDLDSVENQNLFLKTLEKFRKIYSFKEDIVICDKHPYYFTSKLAKEISNNVYPLQHHYAHTLSVMFEHNLKGEYLAVVFDGTGFGDDGNIWGGEFFIVGDNYFKRAHHIKYFNLIGNERAIKNPANMAVSLIKEELAKKYPNYLLVKNLKKEMFPLTSSMGRVFDIIAFLGGFIQKQEYEGFSGLRIEKFFVPSNEYIDLKLEDSIDFTPLFNFAAENRGNLSKISSVFINSIANLIEKAYKYYNLPLILSGGVFQNTTLLREILKRVDRVYFNENIPINDSGISVGQGYWGIREYRE